MAIKKETNPDIKLREAIWRLVAKHSKNSEGKIMSSIRFSLDELVGKKGPVYELKMITTTWKHPKKKANREKVR